MRSAGILDDNSEDTQGGGAGGGGADPSVPFDPGTARTGAEGAAAPPGINVDSTGFGDGAARGVDPSGPLDQASPVRLGSQIEQPTQEIPPEELPPEPIDEGEQPWQEVPPEVIEGEPLPPDDSVPPPEPIDEGEGTAARGFDPSGPLDRASPDRLGSQIEQPTQEPPPVPPPEPPPHADRDGIPNEYGEGPDLDGNGIPDEIGINPDSFQPGYPNQSTTSVDWGGVAVPDPTVVPQSGATTGAEAMPEGEEYGGGSDLGGNRAPDETAIDLGGYADSSWSTSGDEGAWDPYAGSSSPFEPYAPAEEEASAAIPEGEDPDAPTI